MSVSLMLTYVPEKRGEVHSEHKPSTFSLSSKNEVFPSGLSLLGFRFIFSCVGQRRSEGKASQTCPPSGPWAGLDPSTPEGWRASQVLAVNPGVRTLHLGG